MQLLVRCEKCATIDVVHRGRMIDLPQGIALVQKISDADHAHKCPPKAKK